jgi:IPT/TIG domain
MRSRRLPALLSTVALAVLTAVVTAAPAGAQTRGSAVSTGAHYAQSRGYYVGIAVLDTKTGAFFGSGHYQSFFASESVVKVFIATRLLVSGRMHGSTASRAFKMITQSDDTIASSFYNTVGGDSLINWVKQRYHVPSLGTPPHRANWWGNTHIRPGGLVRLYAKLKRDPKVGPWLLHAMHHATQYGSDGTYQFFGLPSATSGAAIKQGWGADFDDWFNSADFNTTGFVNHDRYAVAILARGPISTYGSAIGGLLTQVARRVLPGGVFPDPLPRLTSVSRRSGRTAGGGGVLLRGTDFTGTRRVLFGGVPAHFSVLSPGRIRAVSPRHGAGTVAIRVVTSHGNSAVVRAGTFSYVAPPTVRAVTPNQGQVAGNQQITVVGSNFTHVTGVSFGTVAGRGVRVLSPSKLTVTAPAAKSAGGVHLRVQTAYGRSRPVSADVYHYLPVPVITGTSGSGTQGQSVTVTGTGFTGATQVLFGAGDPAHTFGVTANGTKLTATAPPHSPGGVHIRIVTAGGMSRISPQDWFTYTG